MPKAPKIVERIIPQGENMPAPQSLGIKLPIVVPTNIPIHIKVLGLMALWLVVYQRPTRLCYNGLMNRINKLTDRIFCWFQYHGKTRTVLIFALMVLCIFEVSSIFNAVQSTIEEHYQSSYRNVYHQAERKNLSVDEIESWMTFAYINFVFKLPTNYLQSDLQLFDSRYPNIQIRRYARMNHLDEAELVKNVQNAVTSFNQ